MATAEASRRAQSRSAKTLTIERAARLLACFSAASPQLSLTELSRRLRLRPSTVYRYAATLVDARLLAKDRRTNRYEIGMRVVELAGLVLGQHEVVRHAIDEINRLSSQLGVAVNLRVLTEGDVLHLAHAAPPDSLPVSASVGRRAAAHCTGAGKALLADRPWREVLSIIRKYGWRLYTANSIRSRAALRADLNATRRRGYAVDVEERRVGVACLALPIRDRTGDAVAALSATFPSARLTPEFTDHVVTALRNATERISLSLGYPGGDVYPASRSEGGD